MKSLSALVKAARDAPPETRIQFRDPIAAHGAEAITAVTPWLADPRLGAFAARVIAAVGRQGHATEAVKAFTAALSGARDAARTEHRNVVEAANRGPLRHHSTPTGVNWRVSTPALACSNHGSGSPSSENCSRSQRRLRNAASSRIFFFTWSRPTRAT